MDVEYATSLATGHQPLTRPPRASLPVDLASDHRQFLPRRCFCRTGLTTLGGMVGGVAVAVVGETPGSNVRAPALGNLAPEKRSTLLSRGCRRLGCWARALSRGDSSHSQVAPRHALVRPSAWPSAGDRDSDQGSCVARSLARDAEQPGHAVLAAGICTTRALSAPKSLSLRAGPKS